MKSSVPENWPERADIVYLQLQTQVMWRWLAIIVGGMVILLGPMSERTRWPLTLLLLGIAAVNAILSILIKTRRLPLSQRNVGVGMDILAISMGIYFSQGWQSSLYVLYALSILQQPLVMSLRQIVTVTFAASLSYLASLALRGDFGLIWLEPEILVKIAFRNCFLFMTAFVADRAVRRNLSEYIKSEAIFDSSAEGMVVVDTERRIQRINASGERLLRLPRKDVLGRCCEEVLRGELCNEGCPLLLAMSKRGSVTNVQEKLKPTEERRFPTRTSAAALIDSQERVVGATMSFQDISERMAHEEAQEEFLAAVSHELRSPLSSMASLAELLAVGEMENPEVVKEYGGILWKESNRLVDFLEKLKRLSRLERDELVITLENTELKDLCESAVSIVSKEAEGRNVNLRVEVPSDSGMALVDKDLTLQVLVNLLENAIRYSRKGTEVILSAKEVDGAPVVTVQDQGRGIPSEELSLVFNKFYRGEWAREMSPHGTGLGLAMVQRMSDLMGAKISVWSKEGEGTRFKITFRASNRVKEWAMEG